MPEYVYSGNSGSACKDANSKVQNSLSVFVLFGINQWKFPFYIVSLVLVLLFRRMDIWKQRYITSIVLLFLYLVNTNDFLIYIISLNSNYKILGSHHASPK